MLQQSRRPPQAAEILNLSDVGEAYAQSLPHTLRAVEASRPQGRIKKTTAEVLPRGRDQRTPCVDRTMSYGPNLLLGLRLVWRNCTTKIMFPFTRKTTRYFNLVSIAWRYSPLRI